MSRGSTSLWPGTARITLVVLAVVPAAMAYPWQSTRDRWLLGIAAAVVIVLLARWRGLHLTTILRRRVAMTGRNHGVRPVRTSGSDVRTTALLRITPPATEPDVLPLPLIARYLDCYGIRADAIRITSRDTASDIRETWIGLTLSAADNLAALRARSPRIPLHKTAEVAVRRLADQLREVGWAAAIAGPEDIPPLFTPSARETWRGVLGLNTNYVAAYRVNADAAMPDTLAAIRAHPARETWTSLEIGSDASGPTLAAGCAFRTDARPGAAAPKPGLTSQHGNHGPALNELDPRSTERLDGHADLPAGLLTRLRWSSAVPEQSRPRHAAAR